jgi:hypothetical protein
MALSALRKFAPADGFSAFSTYAQRFVSRSKNKGFCLDFQLFLSRIDLGAVFR